MNVAVLGGGGFIGGHLVARLLEDGHRTTAVDVKPLGSWWQQHDGAEKCALSDLREMNEARDACRGQDWVFDLACNMGGISFIEGHKIDCMRSVLIGVNVLEAAREESVHKVFYASSACIYPAYRQTDAKVVALEESMAYPADCEDGYGWEKLFTERLCRHYDDEVLATRVGRLHNVYGPMGSWVGGREKSPAAICRKVAEAKMRGRYSIEVWGDGEQTRSFCYIDDCVDGILRVFHSSHPEPTNIGSDRLISINDLVALVQEIAGTNLRVEHIEGPLGVRGRNSDNTLLRERTGWEPTTSLEDGMAKTYAWIYDQVAASLA
jgi:GDP-D-mannose 3', 5'-epimerase